MKTLLRPARAVPVIALATALSLAACGSDDGAAADADGGSAADEDAGASGDTDGGGVLRVGADTTVVAIDPHQYSAESAVLTVALHVYDTLVVRDGDEFVPSLAESWDNPDELTWVFHLRDDVTFHDGSPLTASDFTASLQRLLDLEAPGAPLWATLESAEAIDDHTVEIRTSDPMGTMLSSLALLYVLPADLVDEPDYFRNPVGSGAYVVEEFTPDERTVLVRNDDYWGEPPSLDRIEFYEIPELSTRMTALETGEIDLTIGIPQDQIETIRSNPNLEYGSAPSYVYSFIWFNHDREPFDNVDVRRALWHALDIETVVTQILGDSASVSQAPIPQSVFGASQEIPYEYNPELARQLLADAGYADGLDIEMQYNEGHFSNIRDVAATFVSYWADIGVTVTPLEKQRAEWIEDLEGKNFDLNLQGNTVQTGDADYTLARLYLCSSDRFGYCNEELDDLLLGARTTLDLEERERLYSEAISIMWDEAIGIFPMEFERNAAWHSYVEGFEPPPSVADFHQVTVNR